MSLSCQVNTFVVLSLCFLLCPYVVYLSVFRPLVSPVCHVSIWFIPSPTVKFTCLYLSLIVFVCVNSFFILSLMSCLCYVQFCFPSLVSLILFSRVPSCVHSALMPSSVYLCCVVHVSSVFPLWSGSFLVLAGVFAFLSPKIKQSSLVHPLSLGSAFTATQLTVTKPLKFKYTVLNE